MFTFYTSINKELFKTSKVITCNSYYCYHDCLTDPKSDLKDRNRNEPTGKYIHLSYNETNKAL